MYFVEIAISVIKTFMPGEILDKCHLDLSYFQKQLWKEAKIGKIFERVSCRLCFDE